MLETLTLVGYLPVALLLAGIAAAALGLRYAATAGHPVRATRACVVLVSGAILGAAIGVNLYAALLA